MKDLLLNYPNISYIIFISLFFISTFIFGKIYTLINHK